MLRRVFIAFNALGAFSTWFFRGTIESWFFDKVVKVTPWDNYYLIEYGIPLLFAGICIWLICKKSPSNPMLPPTESARQMLGTLREQTTKSFVPMHEAIAHIAKCIGDSEDNYFFGETRKLLRQEALNGTVKVRGHKQIDDHTESIKFNAVETNVPQEYWELSEIGALAASPSLLHMSDTHTSPQSVYAWGAKGWDEKKRYSQLRIDWDDVLKLWPN